MYKLKTFVNYLIRADLTLQVFPHVAVHYKTYLSDSRPPTFIKATASTRSLLLSHICMTPGVFKMLHVENQHITIFM